MGNKSAKLSASCCAGPLGASTKEDIVKAVMKIVQSTLLEEIQTAVNFGDKPFSSVVLSKSDLSLVVSNRDQTKTKNPTATSELNTIEAFFSISDDARPKSEDSIFVTMFEPTSVALCDIAIAGFDNFVYLFTRETATELGVEPSTCSLVELFGKQDETYQPKNKYWTSFCLLELIENCANSQEHFTAVDNIKTKLQELVKPADDARPDQEAVPKTNE